MKKFFALTAAVLLCGGMAYALEAGSAPASQSASAPAISPATSSSTPASLPVTLLPPNGLISSVDTAAQSFTMMSRGREIKGSYSAETQFYLSNPALDAKPELADGKTVEVFGRLNPEMDSFLSVTRIGVYTSAEGKKSPKNLVNIIQAVGTLKKDGEKMSVIVKSDKGEKVVSLGDSQPMMIYAVQNSDAATTLQPQRYVLLQGEMQGDVFKAAEVHASQAIRVRPNMASMPASAAMSARASVSASAPASAAVEK